MIIYIIMFPFHSIIAPVLKCGITFSYLYFLHFYVKTKLPIHYDYACFYLSYNAIFWYSKGELYYLKYKKHLTIQYNELVEKNIYVTFFTLMIKNYCKYSKKNNKKNKLCVEFIKDGEMVLNITKEELFTERNNSVFQLPQNFDFIIYSHTKSNDKSVSKLIFYDIPSKEEIDNYEVSSASILMTELIIQDKRIKVSFKDSVYNYFIVNNIFTTAFMFYFFKKYHSTESIGITKEHFESSFEMNMLDADVNQLTIKNNDSVRIEKESLKIVKEYEKEYEKESRIQMEKKCIQIIKEHETNLLEELDYNIVD